MGDVLTPDQLLTRPPGVARAGTLGTESDWIALGELDCGPRLLFVDASFIPSENDGVVVDLAPGRYAVSFRILGYGDDWRVSSLRATRGPVERRGAVLGKTWTDAGRTAICDPVLLGPWWDLDPDAAYARVASVLESGAPFGVAVFDAAAGAVVPFVESGFGDGEYPVVELLGPSGERVGAE